MFKDRDGNMSTFIVVVLWYYNSKYFIICSSELN